MEGSFISLCLSCLFFFLFLSFLFDSTSASPSTLHSISPFPCSVPSFFSFFLSTADPPGPLQIFIHDIKSSDGPSINSERPSGEGHESTPVGLKSNDIGVSTSCSFSLRISERHLTDSFSLFFPLISCNSVLRYVLTRFDLTYTTRPNFHVSVSVRAAPSLGRHPVPSVVSPVLRLAIPSPDPLVVFITLLVTAATIFHQRRLRPFLEYGHPLWDRALAQPFNPVQFV